MKLRVVVLIGVAATACSAKPDSAVTGDPPAPVPSTPGNADTSDVSATPATPAAASSDVTQDNPACDFDLLPFPAGSELLTEVPNVKEAYDGDGGGDSRCSFYLFSWNNFLWSVHNKTTAKDTYPLFLEWAPWTYLAEGKAPGSFSGRVAPNTIAELNKYIGEAGDDYAVISSLTGNPVEYDVRMNNAMYDFSYDARLTSVDCIKQHYQDTNGDMQNVWLPPNGSQNDDSIETKYSWMPFEPGECPSNKMFCSGDLGLVGIHWVQKTAKHGEWVWSSFEYVDTSPDCEPEMTFNGRTVATANPISKEPPWIFFSYDAWASHYNTRDAKCTVPTLDSPYIGGSKGDTLCNDGVPADISSPPVYCNQNPLEKARYCVTATDTSPADFQAVNICRTNTLPLATSMEPADYAVKNSTPEGNQGQVSWLNARVSGDYTGIPEVALEGVDPVWRNYVMIGAEWAATQPVPVDQLVSFPVNSTTTDNCGGKACDVAGFKHLANTTLETWMQEGAETPPPLGGHTFAQTDCFACHESNTTSWGQVDFSHLYTRLNSSTNYCDPAAPTN